MSTVNKTLPIHSIALKSIKSGFTVASKGGDYLDYYLTNESLIIVDTTLPLQLGSDSKLVTKLLIVTNS